MENKIEEKPSVAICGGSVVIFAGLFGLPRIGMPRSEFG